MWPWPIEAATIRSLSVVALVDDLGEGHAAAAAGKVDDLHGAGDQGEILQGLADLPAGEVPAAAGVGRRDAFGSSGLEGQRRRRPATVGGQRSGGDARAKV